MTNNTSINSIASLIAMAMICVSLGCEQQRYSPSAWTPATGGNGTLPGVGQLSSGGANPSAGSLPTRNGSLPGRAGAGSLPSRSYTSLPGRAGNQTSLPNRGGGTLPNRQQIAVQRPARRGKPALPSLEGKPVWDVTEKREMPRVRGKLGLYMGESEGIIGLPAENFQQRGSGSTLPSRNGTTLPATARKSTWNTLPGR